MERKGFDRIDYWTKHSLLSFVCRAVPFLVLALILGSSPIWADFIEPIGRKELPVKAKDLLDSKFFSSRVAFAAKEVKYFSRKYKVILADGTKLKFNRDGSLREIDAKFSFVPFEFIPVEIIDYAKAHYPDERIVALEIKKNVYKIDLSNSLELEFDKEYFTLVRMED